MRKPSLSFLAVILTITSLVVGQSYAEEAIIAVATNFTDAANEIAAAFAATTGHQALLSFGATGQLYTQIAQGAPFEAFLAADDNLPARAINEGYGVEGTLFTYAIGRLVLYSAQVERVDGPETLARNDFDKIAIANPDTAPYGRAAVETMQSLGVYDALQSKLVQGQNIGQAFQFIETGNAEIGFVALGQVSQNETGSRWIVPLGHYQPIKQDAVLLKIGQDNPAAVAFLEFLKGEEAVRIIEKYGYAIDR